MEFRHIVGIAIAALATTCMAGTAGASQEWPLCGHGRRITCIVDGDTFWKDRIKYRIVGVDASEAGNGAQCGRERDLASKATALLQRLMRAPGLQLSAQGKDRYRPVLVRVTNLEG